MSRSPTAPGGPVFRLREAGRSAHAAGGGIGQALSMAIGAAVAQPERLTLALVGDGGLMLNAAELPTAVQEKTGLVLLVMNDRGYGILRNLADAQFEGRRIYSDLHTPAFDAIAQAFGYAYHRVDTLEGLENRLRGVLADRAGQRSSNSTSTPSARWRDRSPDPASDA